MAKIHLTQDEILKRMANGWELCSNQGGHFWVEKGDIRERVSIHSGTVRALVRQSKMMAAPRPGEEAWLTRYVLTDGS
jgi:predicted RNA binding protein YcfA (HicA-like mRNA interferase family)